MNFFQQLMKWPSSGKITIKLTAMLQKQLDWSRNVQNFFSINCKNFSSLRLKKDLTKKKTARVLSKVFEG